jgi:hypothetical protein
MLRESIEFFYFTNQFRNIVKRWLNRRGCSLARHFTRLLSQLFHELSLQMIALLLLLSLPFTHGDFTYTDFNSTPGLAFNGAAEVTDCGKGEASAFVGSNATDSSASLLQFGHTATIELFTSIETDNHTSSSSDDIALREAVFGHRHDLDVDAAAAANVDDAGCSSRIRLTPSHPSKAGSVWYDTRVPVLRGFETTFTWQIIDHSKECSIHTDRAFAQYEHESCAIHGGDGFAFVIHGDPADESALGGDGEQLGYGGIMNSGKRPSHQCVYFHVLFGSLGRCVRMHMHIQLLSSLTPGQM